MLIFSYEIAGAAGRSGAARQQPRQVSIKPIIFSHFKYEFRHLQSFSVILSHFKYEFRRLQSFSVIFSQFKYEFRHLWGILD